MFEEFRPGISYMNYKTCITICLITMITRIVVVSVKFVLAQYEEMSSQSVRWSIHIKSEPFTNTPPSNTKNVKERELEEERGMERKEEG